jgi:hypothetical protein
MQTKLLNEQDLEMIRARGIAAEQILAQLERFKRGAVPVNLVRPATIGDGVARFPEAEEQELLSRFSKQSVSRKVIKFVPASGAASRMFQALQNYIAGPGGGQAGGGDNPFIRDFIRGIEERKFAFCDDLQEILAEDGLQLEQLIADRDYRPIIDAILNPKGLNYALLPKALVKFHKYKDYSRTALEEHLIEGIAYARGDQDVVQIHFTITQEFEQTFKNFVESILSRYEAGGIKFDIRFSHQKSSTDMVAVDEKNNLFRGAQGRLILRPGGHGALIENLNDLDGDIIFIKNIDNVAPDSLQAETIKYKQILGGYLIKLQDQVFGLLRMLCDGGAKDSLDREIETAARYAQEYLNISYPADFAGWEREMKRDFLIKKLNRPMRVCGMVKNEGEPGGGPFWVKGQDGIISLQIIEAAQIDKRSAQGAILEKATHFNPVDLVCGVKDYRGKKFDLLKFVDPEAYFISEKSRDGRRLIAMELPGLWNGAMADWNTIFVEVAISTFTPVKTVNDLLRSEHQVCSAG